MNKKLILKTSFQVIQKTGLEGFTMRELARALNCQPASIYHYYANKNDILNDLYMKIYNSFFSDLIIEEGKLEEYLFEFCSRVQLHRKKYLFVIKHAHAKFLYKENIQEIRESKKRDLVVMKKILDVEDLDVVDYLLIKGPINELAFLEDSKLSELQLHKMVSRMINSAKGGY